MPLTTLVRRSFSRAAAAFAAVTGVLSAFQLIMVLTATVYQNANSFETIASLVPASLQRAMGSSMMTLASFQGIVTFGYFHPVAVLVIVQVAAYMATESAGEVEWGLFDLQLSRPIPRHAVVTRSLILSFGLTVAAAAAMVATTWLGLVWFAPAGAKWPSARTLLKLAAHLVMLGWCFAAAGAAAAAFARRRGTAFGFTAGGVVVLYLLSVVADLWEPAAPLRWISPFHYFSGVAVVNGTASTAFDLAVLAIPVVGFSLVAYWQFGRRDL
jgi:ABC-2 type transport system permease protein